MNDLMRRYAKPADAPLDRLDQRLCRKGLRKIGDASEISIHSSVEPRAIVGR